MTRKLLLVALAVTLVVVAAASARVLHGRSATVPAAVEKKTPTATELASFSDRKIFFGHQSVGMNIIDGLQATYSPSGRPTLTVVESRTAPARTGGYLAHAPMGVNGDPIGKFADFTTVMNGSMGKAVDVAMLKLCYVDVTAQTDVDALFKKYSAMMAQLEAAHPDVTFIYTTVPLTTDRGWKQKVKSWLGRDDQMGPADNAARERYNQLVRKQYSQTGRFFDIAAVESTMDSAPAERKRDGVPYYVLNNGLAADPGHLNGVGSRAAAAEFVSVVAAQ